MEIRHLQSFVAAATKESFTRAAEELGLTQAAISQHISVLEKELGTTLFDRKGRCVMPNAEGRKFHRYAQQILDILAVALKEIGHTDHIIQGVLTMAVSSVPARSLLPAILTEFRKQHPDVVEEISITDSQKAIAQVESGQVDIGLVGEMPKSAKLTVVEIAKDEMVLVSKSDHPLASESQPISIETLEKYPLIFREPGSGSRNCIAAALEEKGIGLAELQIGVVMDSNEAILDAVAHGLGAAFFSQEMVAAEVESGNLTTIAIQGIQLTRSLYLISEKTKLTSEACRAFLDFVQEHYAEVG